MPVEGVDLRVLWRVDGTDPLDNVRFRIEGPTSGWVALGFVNGTCAIDSGSDCMAGKKKFIFHLSLFNICCCSCFFFFLKKKQKNDI